MTEGMEDNVTAGPVSPAGSTVDTGQEQKEAEQKEEETGPAEEEKQDGIEQGHEGSAQDGGDNDPAEVDSAPVAAAVSCCVCVRMEHVDSCLHSEKICLLPILACLLSLALCTAGLKWVFVDRIFEYEPHTHLDPKRIGQDPFVISADPTPGWTSARSASPRSPASERPEVLLEDRSTPRPFAPPDATRSDSSVTLKYNAEKTTPNQTPDRTPDQTPDQTRARSTQAISSNHIPTISSTSTTTTLKTSSHVTRCSDSQKNYCVNGGECFTLEITPGSTKFLCRCPNEFTGDRCQNYVMASFYKAEELYQKRILTITGICIALLVVGIMCVVAYCRTKKERKKLHDRLKQSLRRKRKSGSNSTRGRPSSQLVLRDLQRPDKSDAETVETTEKDPETSVSPSKSVMEPTAITHISQSWSHEWSTSVPSDSESVSVMSLAESSQRESQGRRGRLYATGGTRDVNPASTGT